MARLPYMESLDRAEGLLAQAHEVRRAAQRGEATWTAALEAFDAVLAFPCSLHHFEPDELLDEQFELLRNAGRFEDAIDAKYRAIAAGLRSQPDPEADVAECLLQLGRNNEGDALYAELLGRDATDEYLFNSAGWAYAQIGDHATALDWITRGIDVAIGNGDQDQIAGQLLAMAERSWAALGVEPDEALRQRVAAFERDWVRPPYVDRFGPAPQRPAAQRCDVCDFDPEAPPPSVDDWTRQFQARVAASAPELKPAGPASALAFAWFDREQWPLAIERWPDLLDECPADHTAYCRRLESMLKAFAATARCQQLSIASVTIDAIYAYAAETGGDAGTSATRSVVAARGACDGSAAAWPPARNNPCCCGSGVKYKKCCGPVAPKPD